MKANEITLALLKANKVINLENGNIVEFIKTSTYNETAYNNAIARGEDIVLFKTSVSDNKARAIISVNGVESSYPLYINEIKKFAESGNAPKHKENFFEVGETTTKEPRTISEGAAKKRNLLPLSVLGTEGDISFLEAEAKHFEDAVNLIREYSKKYGFSENRGALGNAFCGLSVYKKYQGKMLHIKEVAERYKQRVKKYHTEKQEEADNAETMQEKWLSQNWRQLNTKEGRRKAQELQENADRAKQELQEALNRKYYSDSDIMKKYGI